MVMSFTNKIISEIWFLWELRDIWSCYFWMHIFLSNFWIQFSWTIVQACCVPTQPMKIDSQVKLSSQKGSGMITVQKKLGNQCSKVIMNDLALEKNSGTIHTLLNMRESKLQSRIFCYVQILMSKKIRTSTPPYCWYL